MNRLNRILLMLTIGLALGVIAVFVLGSPHHTTSVDMANPEAVARAYYVSLYECGEKGAGARYDLTTSTRRTWSRNTYLQIERRSGCEPRQPPSFDVHTIARIEDETIVAVTAPGVDAPLVLIRDESDAWRVNTLRTHQPDRAPRGASA